MLATLLEDPGLIFYTQTGQLTAACHSSPRRSNALFCPPWPSAYIWYTDILEGTHTHRMNKSFIKKTLFLTNLCIMNKRPVWVTIRPLTIWGSLCISWTDRDIPGVLRKHTCQSITISLPLLNSLLYSPRNFIQFWVTNSPVTGNFIYKYGIMEAKVSFSLTTDFHVCLSKQLHVWLWRLGARSHVGVGVFALR